MIGAYYDMPAKQHHVQLNNQERTHLENLTRKGQVQVRVYKRARILLLAHQGLNDADIATQTASSPRTIQRIRKRFTTERAQVAIAEKPRPGRPSKLTPEQRAKITALACSTPPAGYARWSLRLLADRAVELELVACVSHETIGVILKKTS